MAEKTYRRGQIHWALWHCFFRSGTGGAKIPDTFLGRIKRLQEVDGKFDFSDFEVLPEADYAFAPPPSPESGEVAYSVFDVFCFAIALDLLDAGFKRSEIVILLRYFRPDLKKLFPDMLASPFPISRQRGDVKEFPKLPTYEKGGKKYPDGRVFVILQKIELTEVIPSSWRKRDKDPVIFVPVFCHGIGELGEKLHVIMPHRRRAATVLEIAETAQVVQKYLVNAPNKRRGRPKS